MLILSYSNTHTHTHKYILFHWISIEDLVIDKSTDTLRGVKTAEDEIIPCKTAVLTTGTFLRGICHIGLKKYPAGRHLRDSDDTEPPSIGLSNTLKEYEFPLGRLTTGTPPRISAKSINY